MWILDFGFWDLEFVFILCIYELRDLAFQRFILIDLECGFGEEKRGIALHECRM
jgi:hypothetical protein